MGQTKKKRRRRVRFAVVGLGHIAQVAVLPAFAHAENCKLVALVSDDPKKQRKLAREYGVETVTDYAGYDELLASGEVDAVYIALPNHLHREYTVRAAKHGIHVLCEKPMAVTEEECREMIRACDEAGVKLMVAYRLHFERANLDAIEFARRGKLGELRMFTSSFSQTVKDGDIRLAPIAKGGGSLYDMGIYCINAARYLFRDEPTRVSAISARRADDPRFQACDEMTSGILEFPGDRIATFLSSFGAAPTSSYTLAGDRGSLEMNPAYGYATELTYTLTLKNKRPKHRRFEQRDQFAPELIHFARCVLDDDQPEPGGWEGLADVRIVQALYRSAELGRPVDVEPMKQDERHPGRHQEMHRPAVEEPPTVNVSSPSGD